MTIPPEIEAQILRLFHAEHWPIGTIATQLAVHHAVVARVIEKDGVAPSTGSRASKLDAFVPFVTDTLRRYPRLSATRLHEMACERGLKSSVTHFRRLVARVRPRPPAEAYLRLKTLPGEQAQVDWAHFGMYSIRKATRPLMAFVMVLSYSRRIFLRFYLGAQTENFLRGHEAAFQRFGAVPRCVLYDNLKSAVLERKGDAIRFHPPLLAFSAHYRFEPRPVAVARGNEKGRVERSILYIRTAFYAARTYRDFDDLNAQAEAWCDGPALQRPWAEEDSRTVADAFAEESSHLLLLPADGFPTDERREVKIGKTPYARFDGNDYSVPHEHVRKILVVIGTPTSVRILDGTQVVAEHARSYGRRETIEDPRHVERLVEAKSNARHHRAIDRLHHAAPTTQALLTRLAERGEPLSSATRQFLKLLDEFGAAALEKAACQSLAKDSPHPRSVRLALDRERRALGEAPRIPVQLPDDPRVKNLAVSAHELASYDAIANPPTEKQEDGHGAV